VVVYGGWTCSLRIVYTSDPQAGRIDIVVLRASTPEVCEGLRSEVRIEEIVVACLPRFDPPAETVICVVALCACAERPIVI
jgi:hypothetical protein